MATIPTVNGNTPVYRPLFNRVAQNDLKDIHCADLMGEFACIATVCGVSLDNVRDLAIKNHRFPRHGAAWVTEDLIEKLFAAHGWTATAWKEVLTPLSGLPDIAILMIDYDEATEIGRSVVYQRAASKDNSKGFVEHVIDPAYWVPKEKQVSTDIKGITPSWYIGLFPMPYPTSGIPKVPPPTAKK